jgi:hypothetical protein
MSGRGILFYDPGLVLEFLGPLWLAPFFSAEIPALR